MPPTTQPTYPGQLVCLADLPILLVQIRVNTVNPTVVMTPMGQANWSNPQKAKTMLDRIPLGKFAGESGRSPAGSCTSSPSACLDEGWEGRMEEHPLTCALTPTLPAEVENVVDTILFLLSDRSSMTTGSAVPVDGGFLAT